MKLRDEVRQFGQGMEARTALQTSKYGVGYRVVADTHPSGAYHRGSSTAMGDASLDLVCYSLGVPVLIECFFGLWRPSCPAGLKLVFVYCIFLLLSIFFSVKTYTMFAIKSVS